LPADQVTISISEYEALVAKAAAVSAGTLKNYRTMSATRISRCPEHAEFVLERLPVMNVTEVLNAFEARFGKGVISRSQLYRFSQDMGFVRSVR
jgi:hypothetical protein